MPYINKTSITLRIRTKEYLERGKGEGSWGDYLKDLMDFWQKNN